MKPYTKILCIEPDDIYRSVFSKILSAGPYELVFKSTSPEQGCLPEINADILFCSLEIPGCDAFEIYNKIRSKHPELPVIFFTNENINRYLDEFSRTENTNVMAKPFTREELLFFLDKLIHNHRAFGLKNYLKQGSTVKTFFLQESREVRTRITDIFTLAKKWGFEFHYDFKIDLVIHELLVNALYHAYGYEDEKKNGTLISLPEGEVVEVEVGHDENRFGITITDFRGNLTRDRILNALKALENQHRADLLFDSGEGISISEVFKQHGRGIDIVRKNSGEYYFVIEKGQRTQAIIIFDKNFEKDDEFTSIKIIEV